MVHFLSSNYQNQHPEKMKKLNLMILLIPLITVSCSSNNKIFINQDPFKERTTIKLSHTLKGYSDERRRGPHGIPEYYVDFKYTYLENNTTEEGYKYEMDVTMKTRVRPYEVEPVIYICYGDRMTEIPAIENICKMYQQGSSSTSAESTTKTEEDPDDEDEVKTETTTTYTTSSSHDTYQLMHLRFVLDPGLLDQMSSAKHIRYRVYIDNEIIDMPLRRKDRRKFNAYVKTISELYPAESDHLSLY